MALFHGKVLWTVVWLAAAFAPAATRAADAPLAEPPRARSLVFEPNVGQADPAVAFVARGAEHRIELSPTQAIVTVRSPQEVAVVRMRLLGASRSGRLRPLERLPGRSQYLIGPDPKRWRTDIPNYRRVRLDRAYPGIDLVFYGLPDALRYDVILAPDADPGRIHFELEGGARPQLRDGDLIVPTPAGALRLPLPTVYRRIDGTLQPIATRYLLAKGRYVTLALEETRSKHPPR